MVEFLIYAAAFVGTFVAGVLTGANSPKTVDRTVDAAIARLKAAQAKAEVTIGKVTDFKSN